IYKSAKPQWQTVLDIDSLSRAEKAKFNFHAALIKCFGSRCMVGLEPEDPTDFQKGYHWREVDLHAHRLVPGGFNLRGFVGRFAWKARDTLYAATLPPRVALKKW